MTNHQARKQAIEALLAQIRAAAAQDVHPEDFLLDIQCEIERVPGAQVAFVQRDLTWLKDYGYVDADAELSPEALQNALVSVAAEFEEGASSQDHVTHDVSEHFGKCGYGPRDAAPDDDDCGAPAL